MPMKKVCSFCGRGENEVKLLISGLNGQICENCVEQAYQIVSDNLREAPAVKQDCLPLYHIIPA